jgi:nicotinamidase-related amidase
LRHAGFHGRAGLGERPAIVVVDLTLGFTDPESPLACELKDVVEAVARLLEAARRAGVPVVYTTVAYDEEGRRRAATFLRKVPALEFLTAGSPLTEIDPRLAPEPGEPVLTKLHASAFFETDLLRILEDAGCDSIVVVGASTSGCIRATAVDALQHGYPTIVPREGVGDRNAAAHEANLYDIDAKYGDVVPLREVLARLDELAPVHGSR